MYRLTDGRTDWRPHFYFLTNVSCWWGNYSCCILLWRISSLPRLVCPPGRRWASAPWWCCLGPGPSGARPGSCDSYHLQFFSDDTIDDYERWDRLRFGKLSNVEIDEKSLHIRKFFYVCRWCEAVQEFNYLKMTIKRILKMKRMLTMKIDCASFCSKPASSYDVTFALHHKDESKITIASHGERKPPIFLDITARVKWEWFKNTHIFVSHVL